MFCDTSQAVAVIGENSDEIWTPATDQSTHLRGDEKGY
jgi:hypothetical protein